MFLSTYNFAQKDTIYTINSDFETLLKASSKDSMFHDYKNEKLHLFGEAKLSYDDIQVEADYILIDFKLNEVMATYSIDKDSNRIGLPVFKEGAEEIIAAKIRYNFDTKKGYIQEVKIKQDENFLYMDVAKRLPNEHIHFQKGKFTSCDLEEPHFHLFLTKAVMIPEKRIVSGPLNVWIQGVPTPLGLPFMLIPQKKEREQKHGFLFPQYSIQSPYGMGFQNLGYYIPLNDSLQTTIFANLYARGSWGLSSETDYRIKYRFDGRFSFGYQQFRTGFPTTGSQNKLSLNWYHKQDPKANPYWNFSSNVNFMSDNSPKTNLDPINQNYFDNTLYSDININRLFPGKPITTGLKLSVKQNSQTKNIAVTSPVFNLNVTRFSPFSFLNRKKIGEKKWYEQIGMTYNLEAQNRSTFQDSLIRDKRYDLIGNSFQNGIQQNTTIQSTIALFKNVLKVNPSITYSNKINFQQIRKQYDTISNNTLIDTLKKAGVTQQISFNLQFTTVVYSYYKFVGKNKALLRHILTPSIGLNYTPNLLKGITDSVGFNKNIETYSPFERSIYAQGITQAAGLITFGINNTFELKHKSSKDTLTGFKKTRIIDGLTFNGSYNMLKDSMRLSSINSSIRISPLEAISIVGNAIFSPYDWDDSTKLEINKFAFESRSIIARLMAFNITTTLNITSKKSQKRLNENKENMMNNWTSDLNYFALNPYQIVDFEIPWKLSISHIYSSNVLTGFNALNSSRKYNATHTLQFNPDISITKRWKVLSTINVDLVSKNITNSRLTVTRDMHCWNLAFYWTPIGNNKSFLLRISANSSLFQSAKLEFKKPPVF
jgi:hypothetical protein